MTEPAALDARATSLRALADEVEVVVGPPLTRALQPVWQCPHAEQVRAALRTQRSQARAAAERLRETARRLNQQAADLRAERAAQARREEHERQERERAERERTARTP